MATLRVPVTPDDHIWGNNDAPVTLVEYGDYECPHCGRAHPIVKALQAEYGPETLRFVFRNFPMTQIHPLAEPAAETAEYAGANGKFWEMHDAIYDNQPSLSLPMLFELAEALDLSAKGLSESLETHEFLPKIRNDFLGGVKNGVNGTPTFFINGVRHEGSYEYEDLADAIETQLAGQRRRMA
jgi:protein-disulfide isomerase